MKKLTALGMITLTLTSMIPLTANAAVTKYFGQCNTGRNNYVTINGSNVEDLKAKLKQFGIDEKCADLLGNGNSTKSNFPKYTGNKNGSDCNNGSGNNGSGSNNGSGNNGSGSNNGSGNNGSGSNNGSGDNGSGDNGSGSNNGSGDNGSGSSNGSGDNGSGSNNGSGDNGSGSNDTTENKTYTQQVVDLVNAERAKEGLAPLTIDPVVEKAADVRAREIQSKFDHTRPNGSSFSSALKEQGADFRGAGENIAWGQQTPKEVMNAWMNSPGHRANIMNKSYTHIGVGNVQNGSGTQYWVQLFTY
ncbi:CAP domain-containing protein [Lacrimispora sp.]|uniref:CAP domain-containing protein n=1 Tax=Lacrimispora sp. TaxID=2719234 RepID=UPI00346111EB